MSSCTLCTHKCLYNFLCAEACLSIPTAVVKYPPQVFLSMNTRQKPVTAWPGKRSKVIEQESMDSWRKIKQHIQRWHQRTSLNRDSSGDDCISYIWLTGSNMLWALFEYGRVWAPWFYIQVVDMELSHTDWRAHANGHLTKQTLQTHTKFCFSNLFYWLLLKYAMINNFINNVPNVYV